MAMSEDMKLLLVIKARSDAAAAFDSVSKKLDQLIAKGAEVGSGMSGIGGAIGKGVLGFGTALFADRAMRDLAKAAEAVTNLRDSLGGAELSWSQFIQATVVELPFIDDVTKAFIKIDHAIFHYDEHLSELRDQQGRHALAVFRDVMAKEQARTATEKLADSERELFQVEQDRAAALSKVRNAFGEAGQGSQEQQMLLNKVFDERAAEVRRKSMAKANDELRAMAEKNQRESDAVIKKREDARAAAAKMVEEQIARVRLDVMADTGQRLESILDGIHAKYSQLRDKTTNELESGLLRQAEAAEVLRAQLADAKDDLGEIKKNSDKVKINTLTGGISADAVSGRFSGLAARFIGTDQAQLAEARETKAAVKRQEAVISRIEELLRQTLRGLAPIGIGA